jgi:hypothetical protein
MRQCKRCQEVKPLEDFYQPKDGSNRYQCKSCDSAKKLEYWHKRREKDSDFIRYERRRSTEYLKNNPEFSLLRGAKARAKKKGIPISITKEDIDIPEVCPVLGTPFERGTPYAASLDRVDNNKGYVEGNIQVLSLKANKMKADATQEELERFAQWILKL